MNLFGDTDPKKMPPHFFSGTHDLDYATAIRANIANQDYSVCPRHWYIDARFRCSDCGAEFLWSAREQQTWFETYRFWVDSRPGHCRECRARHRDALQLRQEYDSLVTSARSHGTHAQKQRIIEIVDDLESYWTSVPDKLRETRDVFRQQLARLNSQ
jgi:hypothetical protein